MRQIRGAIVRALRTEPSLTLARMSALTGFELERIGRAVSDLAAEGLLEAGEAARAGRPLGRVRLAA